ncbi:MAG: hypothetical protein Q9208_006693 [Pyrenodesmia sp. 3 TL-2023]
MTSTRNSIFSEDDEQLTTDFPFPPRPAVLFYVDHGQDGSWAGKSLTDRRHNICLPAPSTTFPFLSLPSEIRHEIYLYLFVRPLPIIPFPVYSTTGERRWRPTRLVVPLSFLLACHQVHDEATVIMYGWNTFRFTDEAMKPREDGDLCRFMKVIGIANRCHIRHIELALDASTNASSQGHNMFRDAKDRLKVAVAFLVACFQLRILTVTFYYKMSIYQFSFVLDSFVGIDKKRALQKLNLELSATIKAFERCRL